mmetsp:Transcript_126993/g.230549  ORF Transcript_126993/g.230549 Transcript_126993/m.230549 type:complete len:92 (-) Transcript_126993:854-1129(-)
MSCFVTYIRWHCQSKVSWCLWVRVCKFDSEIEDAGADGRISPGWPGSFSSTVGRLPDRLLELLQEEDERLDFRREAGSTARIATYLCKLTS